MELEYKSGSPSLLWKEGLQRVYLFFGSEDREGLARIFEPLARCNLSGW